MSLQYIVYDVYIILSMNIYEFFYCYHKIYYSSKFSFTFHITKNKTAEIYVDWGFTIYIYTSI